MAGTPLNVKDPENERIVPRTVDMDKIRDILARIDAMPVLDQRPAEDLVADLYDERGFPKQ